MYLFIFILFVTCVLAEWPKPTPLGKRDSWKLRKTRSFTQIIHQPLSFINFYQSDGLGRVSYESIQAQVDQLNRAFSGTEAQLGKYPKPTDSGIRFSLAGVRYVENDNYFNLCGLPSEINVYRPRYMMDGSKHLNIYICWCQYNLGLAWLPYDSWYHQPIRENHYALGAIVHWELLPGNTFNKGLWYKGNILTHEVGHTYGLRHPYEGDCLGNETNSDQIDDTPRMSGNPLTTCQAVRNRNSCKQWPGKDDMSNYMVATADDCRNHFTPGQVDYMQNTIQHYKPTLLKNLPPDCIAAIDSTDNSPDLQPCIQGTLQVARNGRQFCLTDPDNSHIWAWTCCSLTCFEGTPDFSTNSIPTPKKG